MKSIETTPRRRPLLRTALLATVALTAAMVYLRVGVYHDHIVPLTYSVALLIGLWHGNRWLLWGMAACFAVAAAHRVFWIMPYENYVSGTEAFLFLAMQWVNIGVAAGAIHAVLNYREGLERSNADLVLTNAELEAGNEELAAREEEISRQNEELQAQTEELEQQAEELRTQAEELQTLNEELAERENTLHLLLQLTRTAPSESQLLEEICEVAPKLLGEETAAAGILERDNGRFRLLAHSGFGPEGPAAADLPAEATLAMMVLERGQPAELADTGLRCDLQLPRPANGRVFRSVLSSPLRLHGRAVGVLEVYSLEPRSWTPRQVELLEWLALQCSGVWETLRLREELKARQTELRNLNQNLEAKVAERTEELQRRSEELRRLASQLTTAEQRERRRLAQILHDDLQQLLVAAKMRLNMRRGLPGEGQQQVSELIDQAIELSRSLTVEFSPPVLFRERFEMAVRWLARRMREKHALEVEVTVVPDTEPAGEDWKIFLFHAIRECLFNIAKHAGVDRAEVQILRDGEQLCVTVADQGQGFDVAAAVEKSASGDSFGLFSLRQRCQLLGGSLTIVSSPGKGTQIEMRAPVATRMVPSQPTLSQETSQLAPLASPPSDARIDGAIRVLLADDHAILRSGLVSLLRDQPGIDVIGEAPDGQAAVELARLHQPDVVVMDITMPKLTGIEATRVLSREFPTMKIIGMSMHECEETAAEMRRAGAIAYLNKSGHAEHLINEIRRAVCNDGNLGSPRRLLP
jgi:signal transduction histidine kinase/CheY-like chemotaxis protein